MAAGEVGDRRGGRARRPAEAPARVSFEVVYEDDDLLVVDKPAGARDPPGARPLADHARGGAARPGGRRATTPSGRASCTGSTATPRACSWWRSRRRPHAELRARCSRAREIERGYLALVAGHPDAASGTIDAPLGRDRARRDVVSTRTARGRAAVTHFSVREPLPRTALLDVRLETGRTHQIRAHLAAIGHPVCGDPRYGGRACGRAARARRASSSTPRRLMFRHPSTRGNRASASPNHLPSCGVHSHVARQEPVPGGPDGN